MQGSRHQLLRRLPGCHTANGPPITHKRTSGQPSPNVRNLNLGGLVVSIATAGWSSVAAGHHLGGRPARERSTARPFLLEDLGQSGHGIGGVFCCVDRKDMAFQDPPDSSSLARSSSKICAIWNFSVRERARTARMISAVDMVAFFAPHRGMADDLGRGRKDPACPPCLSIRQKRLQPKEIEPDLTSLLVRTRERPPRRSAGIDWLTSRKNQPLKHSAFRSCPSSS